MKIVLATNNKHKVEEIRSCLQNLPLEILSLQLLPEVELKEEGKTLVENALQKGRCVAHATKEWALSDDTGLFVEALKGRPGIFSGRYAGEEASFQDNTNKLLEEMKNIPESKRGAYFSCVMALVSNGGEEILVEGRLEGSIAVKPQGSFGFGYDPIFWLPSRRCTLAEISLEEKNKISHRGQALFKMRGVIEGILKMENSIRK